MRNLLFTTDFVLLSFYRVFRGNILIFYLNVNEISHLFYLIFYFQFIVLSNFSFMYLLLSDYFRKLLFPFQPILNFFREKVH